MPRPIWRADLYPARIPVGTVVWTAPTGHTYITKPSGSIYFPQLALPAGELTLPLRTGPPDLNRGLMMPTRKRTRAQDRRYASLPNGESTRPASPRNAETQGVAGRERRAVCGSPSGAAASVVSMPRDSCGTQSRFALCVDPRPCNISCYKRGHGAPRSFGVPSWRIAVKLRRWARAPGPSTWLLTCTPRLRHHLGAAG